jgi:hypothetical protein
MGMAHAQNAQPTQSVTALTSLSANMVNIQLKVNALCVMQAVIAQMEKKRKHAQQTTSQVKAIQNASLHQITTNIAPPQSFPQIS